MTIQEFKNIKIGDCCYIPYGHAEGKLQGTEVIEKHNRSKKLTVFLGKRPYSYKYVRKKCDVKFIGGYVGICKEPYVPYDPCINLSY